MRPLAVLATIVLALGAACGGGDAPPPSGSPAASPPLGTVGSASGILVLRDAIGDFVARDLATGQEWKRRFDAFTEVGLGVDCSPDGSRIAIMKQVFTDVNRSVLVEGTDAPLQPLRVAAQSQGASWSPDARQLAYTELDTRASMYKVWLLDPGRGEQRQLASGPEFAGPPRWSPDGKQLAYGARFNNSSQIYILEVAGGEPRRVTNESVDFHDPEWAPDGKSLLVTAPDDSGTVQIFRLDPQSGQRTQLTHTAAFKSLPRYSPDGPLVAFIGFATVPQVSAIPPLHQFGIWLMNADGSDERGITDINLDEMLLDWCKPGPWLTADWKKQ